MNQTSENHAKVLAHWVRNESTRSGAQDAMNPFAHAVPVDPWQAFLHARTQVIEWLIEEYNWTDAQIGKQLSLSAGQIQRVRAAHMRSGARHARYGNPNTDITMAAPLDD